jgi:CheY-like chemotaxis protein
MKHSKFKQIKVLLVEDHPITLKAQAAILEDMGCKVDAVTTGEEAILQSKKNRYDVIFVDVVLPDMTGVETVKKMRKNEQGESSAYIVFLSGYAVEKIQKDCLASGADLVKSKPIVSAEIEQVFLRVLGGKGSEK